MKLGSKIDFLILVSILIASQCFYFDVLFSGNFFDFMSYLAPDNHSPHIHEQALNQLLVVNPISIKAHNSFDVVAFSFSWPNHYVGVLTGFGTLLTTACFALIDHIFFMIFLVVLILAVLLSPFLFLWAILFFAFKKDNKSYLVLIFSFLLLAFFIFSCSLQAVSYGWLGSFFVVAGWLFRDGAYYLNTAIYLIFVLWFDFYTIRKLYYFRDSK